MRLLNAGRPLSLQSGAREARPDVSRRGLLCSVTALAATAAMPPEAFASGPSDARLYAAIRQEGLERSQAMAYATSLIDGVGARLLGSPNMRRANDWALARLRDLGADDPRLEPIGVSALAWTPTRVWARMTAPDDAPLVAFASPWSAASPGPVDADVVSVALETDDDLARAKGRLEGKIVLLGTPRVEAESSDQTGAFSDEQVVNGEAAEAVRAYYRTVAERRLRQGREGLFKARRNAFLMAEGVRGVALNGAGASAGAVIVDGRDLGGRPWRTVERPTFPVLSLAAEAFGRCWRLLNVGVRVRMQFEIATEEHDQAQTDYNVVAEIPGRDRRLKTQIVLAGAHLDSWATGTGAADNGAGVAATLEAFRILRAVGFQPRRTLRIVLYAGEEAGLFGSEAYARQRLGYVPRSTAPEQLALAVEGRRAKIGPLARGPEYDDFSIAFNLDSGSGRIRGLFTGGSNPALASRMRDWIMPLKDLGVLAVYDAPDWPADQSTFTEIGLPGISLLQDPLDYDARAHHSHLDTLERLSPADLAQAATVLAVLLFRSADDDERAPRAAMT